ncbi:hypothetical protein AF332_12085 [Sporosarcina globispora]|uniref:Recombinase domain-containing protein n=1 Tax=Sporosarcina globispora TaxID=1459 RepID=A0A0M0GCD8_SPOGL|nr:recombinase family protein [Sporosarcina globispora]KON87494.1 hypothetical protein AF332_12085 [Sporosarcina globispora]
MKRVWNLYRVSTKGQVNPEEDIPMQRNSCLKFIESQTDWKLENELYEKGVSGWKNKTDDRDALVQIKKAAENKEFDILLVFMYDRLGRREDETPLVVQYLVDHGVEVWSVKEGQRKIADHTDLLINYITFWQSSGESKKTSMRVKEIIEQMNEKGQYTGTTPPYGYEVYDTGEKHWKYDKNVKDMRINEDEKKVVEIIFDLYINKGYGVSRIAKYLNSSGYKTRSEKNFRINTIFSILKNPIYTGIKRYNVKNKNNHDEVLPKSEWKYAKKRDDWAFIDEEVFDKVQEIMKMRKDKQGTLPNKGKLLLNGIAICGYCGNKMYSDVTRTSYTLKDGTKKERIIRRYRCLAARTSDTQHDKALYASDKHEKAFYRLFIKQIEILLKNKENLIKSRQANNKNTFTQLESEIDILIKDKNKLEKDLTILNNEITKSLLGESSFSPDQLSNIIKTKETEKDGLGKIIESKKEILDRKKKTLEKEDEFVLSLQKIKDTFDKADLDTKKMMISSVVKQVMFKKDELDITFKVSI